MTERAAVHGNPVTQQAMPSPSPGRARRPAAPSRRPTPSFARGDAMDDGVPALQVRLALTAGPGLGQFPPPAVFVLTNDLLPVSGYTRRAVISVATVLTWFVALPSICERVARHSRGRRRRRRR